MTYTLDELECSCPHCGHANHLPLLGAMVMPLRDVCVRCLANYQVTHVDIAIHHCSGDADPTLMVATRTAAD